MSLSGWNPLSLKLFVLIGTILELSGNCAFFGIFENTSVIDDDIDTLQVNTYEDTQSNVWSSGRIFKLKELEQENHRRRASNTSYVDKKQETVESAKYAKIVSYLNSYQKHVILKNSECKRGKTASVYLCDTRVTYILSLLFASIIISSALVISCCAGLLLQHGLCVSFATITNRPCCNFVYLYGVFIGKAVTLLLNLLFTVLILVFSSRSYFGNISLGDKFLSNPVLQTCLLFTAVSLNVATLVVSWVSAQQCLTHSSFYYEGSIQERTLLREGTSTVIVSNYSV